MSVFLEGVTPEGVHIKVEGDPYVDPGARILFDGVEVPLKLKAGGMLGGRAVSRLRDGGTTYISTMRGEIVAHRAMSREHWDSFEGARLEPVEP